MCSHHKWRWISANGAPVSLDMFPYSQRPGAETHDKPLNFGALSDKHTVTYYIYDVLLLVGVGGFVYVPIISVHMSPNKFSPELPAVFLYVFVTYDLS